MADDPVVLALGAEHDDLRVGVHPHVVPGRPVEEIVRRDGLLRAARIGRRELAAQDEAPVGALAEVPSNPTKSGVVSTPAASVKHSPLIFPSPLASPKSARCRITAPGISNLTFTWSFATRMVDSPSKVLRD